MKFKSLIIASLCIFTFLGCEDKADEQTQTKNEQNLDEQTTATVKTAPQIEQKKADDEAQNSGKITLNLLNGQTIDLEKKENGFNLKSNDKATLFIFFATWCPPCKAEIPHLNNLSEKFKKELNIVGVLLEDKDAQEVAMFAKKYNIKYDVSVGEGNFAFEKAIGGIMGLPSSMLLKPNGEVFSAYRGLVPEEMMESDINKAIEQ